MLRLTDYGDVFRKKIHQFRKHIMQKYVAITSKQYDVATSSWSNKDIITFYQYLLRVYIELLGSTIAGQSVS